MPRSNYVVLAKLQIRYEINWRRKRALMRKYPEGWTTHPHFLYLCKQEEKLGERCSELRVKLHLSVLDRCYAQPCRNKCYLNAGEALVKRKDKTLTKCPVGLNPFVRDNIQHYSDENVYSRMLQMKLKKLERIKRKLLSEKKIYDILETKEVGK